MPDDAGQSAKVQRGRASDRRGLGYQGRAGSSVDVVKRPRFCRTEIFLKAIGGLRARDQHAFGLLVVRAYSRSVGILYLFGFRGPAYRILEKQNHQRPMREYEKNLTHLQPVLLFKDSRGCATAGQPLSGLQSPAMRSPCEKAFQKSRRRTRAINSQPAHFFLPSQIENN